MNGTEKFSPHDINVLVVDDEPAVRDIIQQMLAHGGYNCLVAEDGRKALHVLEQNTVDIVISDIQMPHLDGIELTKIIKERYTCEVIIMTGFVADFSYEEIIDIGASDFIQKPIVMKELLIRVKRVLTEKILLTERNQALEALRESERRYQELSITDGLTKLHNLRHFHDQLNSEIERSNRYHHPLTLLVIDVDDFKHFNDTFGHLEGDHVLIELANAIKGPIRGTDSAYRYGGEEFAVILPETDGNHGKFVAERIKSAIKDKIFTPREGITARVSVSIGVAQFIPGEDSTELITRADIRMYKAKRRGKDQVVFQKVIGTANPPI